MQWKLHNSRSNWRQIPPYSLHLPSAITKRFSIATKRRGVWFWRRRNCVVKTGVLLDNDAVWWTNREARRYGWNNRWERLRRNDERIGCVRRNGPQSGHYFLRRPVDKSGRQRALTTRINKTIFSVDVSRHGNGKLCLWSRDAAACQMPSAIKMLQR